MQVSDFQYGDKREILDFLIGDYILPKNGFYSLGEIEFSNFYRVLSSLQLPRLSDNGIIEDGRKGWKTSGNKYGII